MEKYKRTVMNIGNAFLISPPRGYCNYYDIKPGDKVEVITGNNGVHIKLLKNRSTGDAC